MRRKTIMPDQIIRDIPLIQRYARQNENEDWRFRTHLKATLDLSNEELDAIVRETTDAVWQQIDCTACAHCCKALQIVVDTKDIARLAKRLGMTIRAFSQKYVKVEPDKTKRFNTLPCPFLGADNLCTVYEDRPQACRDYPFLYEPHFRARSMNMVMNAGFCPIVFNVWQSLKHRFKPHKRRR